jgi:hypothetical protein
VFSLDEIQQAATRLGVQRVLDMRLTPGAKNRATSAECLVQRFGEKYRWLRPLAVKNLPHKLAAGEAPIFVDLEQGAKQLATLVRQGVTTWLLIGDAENPHHCARGHVADRFAAELSGVAVSHLRREMSATQEGLFQ